MFTKGEVCNYYTSEGDKAADVTIENINGNIAYSTSGSHGGLGPFAMTFDVNSGNGLNDYLHARIEHKH